MTESVDRKASSRTSHPRSSSKVTHRKFKASRRVDNPLQRLQGPFTPVRRFFFKLELLGNSKPSGSRLVECNGCNMNVVADHSYGNALDLKAGLNEDSLEHVVPGGQSAVPSEHRYSSSEPSEQVLCRAGSQKPCRIALQNEDHAVNAVVVTKLDTIPFCCHEDLVMMPREQLVDVALALNSKLPSVLAIDVAPDRETTFIRSSIEFIVGLRRDVPGAPRAIGTDSQVIEEDDNVGDMTAMDVDERKRFKYRSPTASPLARRRSHMYEMMSGLGSPRLERLEEVEEPLATLRKRKTDKNGTVHSTADLDVAMDSEESRVSNPSIAQALLRATAIKRTNSCPSSRPIPYPATHRVLRSQSTKEGLKVYSVFGEKSKIAQFLLGREKEQGQVGVSARVGCSRSKVRKLYRSRTPREAQNPISLHDEGLPLSPESNIQPMAEMVV